MAFEKLTSSRDLAELCEGAREHGRLGIDTEFLWERTYAPQICLVQLAAAGRIAIVDPFDDIDITPVADLVSDPAVEIVMHAPHADLVGFALRYGATPTTIFDTQIAAGFIGLSAGLSYERLVLETTGEQVQPSESFTDWSRRPLSARQLRYAGEDVEHLFAMADHIQDNLARLGRSEWAREEMERRFGDVSRFATDPDDAWRKVARRGKLQGRELRVLQQVAAWRERSARGRDLPCSWTMKDATLIEVARRKPRRESELTSIRGVEGSMRRGDVQAVLAAVQQGLELPPIDDGPPPPRVVRKRVSIAKGLATALMRARCEAQDIAPELVGTSQDVEDLIGWVVSGRHGRSRNGADGTTNDDADGPSLLRGWRAEFGGDLVALIEGRVQLQLTSREPYLVIHDSRRG